MLAIGVDLDIGRVPRGADKLDAAGEVRLVGGDESVELRRAGAAPGARHDGSCDEVRHLVEELVGAAIRLHEA